MMDLLYALGNWNWIIAGFIMLALELVIPGVFIMWFGLAALVTGGLIFSLEGTFAWAQLWQVQISAFIALSIILVWIGSRMSRKSGPTDSPFLNRRTDALIGHIATLNEPIVDGAGRVRIDDSLWRISGPDLPSGVRVRLTGFTNGAFEVEQAD